MLDVIAATLGTLGWIAGVLLLVTMALLPLIERLGDAAEPSAERDDVALHPTPSEH